MKSCAVPWNGEAAALGKRERPGSAKDRMQPAGGSWKSLVQYTTSEGDDECATTFSFPIRARLALHNLHYSCSGQPRIRKTKSREAPSPKTLFSETM